MFIFYLLQQVWKMDGMNEMMMKAKLYSEYCLLKRTHFWSLTDKGFLVPKTNGNGTVLAARAQLHAQRHRRTL